MIVFWSSNQTISTVENAENKRLVDKEYISLKFEVNKYWKERGYVEGILSKMK